MRLGPMSSADPAGVCRYNKAAKGAARPWDWVGTGRYWVVLGGLGGTGEVWEVWGGGTVCDGVRRCEFRVGQLSCLYSCVS